MQELRAHFRMVEPEHLFLRNQPGDRSTRLHFSDFGESVRTGKSDR